jgi:hypothetical protein
VTLCKWVRQAEVDAAFELDQPRTAPVHGSERGLGGRDDVTVWGGIMTEVAAVRAIAGTVINGVSRDVSASLAHGYPIFSRGRFMRTGKDRVRLVSLSANH